VGRPNQQTSTYSAIAISKYIAVCFVLTTTSLPITLLTSVIEVLCEGLSNDHKIAYRAIAISYCSAMGVVLNTTHILTAVSLLVIVVRCEGLPNQHTNT